LELVDFGGGWFEQPRGTDVPEAVLIMAPAGGVEETAIMGSYCLWYSWVLVARKMNASVVTGGRTEFIHSVAIPYKSC